MTKFQFAYIPSGHMLASHELPDHEYWGEDYVAGKNSVAIFRNEKGSKRAVFTYGKWDAYGLTEGDAVDFTHTQTGRRERLYFVRTNDYCDRGLDRPAFTRKMPTWTLK